MKILINLSCKIEHFAQQFNLIFDIFEISMNSKFKPKNKKKFLKILLFFFVKQKVQLLNFSLGCLTKIAYNQNQT